MYRKFKESMKLIDIYGKQIEFTKDQHPRMKTAIGGFLTIISVALFILFLIINGQELTARQNPNTLNYFKLEISNIPTFVTSPQVFPFSISILDVNGNKLNQSIASVVFIQQIISLNLATQSINVLETNLTTVLCSAANFDASFPVSTQVLYNLQYCVIPATDVEIGNTQDNIISFQPIKRIHMVVSKCQNTTSNNNFCASSDKINSNLQRAQVTFTYGTNYFNSKNYLNPFENSIATDND